ncbi:SDR family NAD(P)-dependent oxidoreductase [Paraliomyxa miuraensis]|uniref:SDR family NAD(P)-dependent oxidoreductase n=1 Tax=Paraliomyxa miuraensis TaxID=376150 RepID=UPI0022517E0A|nr:SDR family NAD(P)-dependent oxidoreductase [Paraliomyxa miuraensis]MCX4243148.1 SDR family NAD(P)-dependent oxidoreductase [Paraliomyxa miuraensis]
MRVLVTGGAGFIGSHLAERLLADGHEVVVIDDESTGHRDNVPARAGYVRGDVADVSQLAPAFRRFGPIDAVCHIAGHVSLIRSFTDPVRDLRTNTLGTLNVIGQCLEHGVGRLMYASSMTVYAGAEIIGPAEDAPCAPISYYGITKYAGERYVHATAARTDLATPLAVTTFRMYSVYGPRQALDNPYQGVLGIFLGNLLRGEPIRIFGDGLQTRDFVYVADVVDAWARALPQPGTHGRVYNLGSGRELSIRALAEQAHATIAAMGVRPAAGIVHAPARPGEQRRVAARIDALRAALGWEPATSFERGLAQTAQWAQHTHSPGDEP